MHLRKHYMKLKCRIAIYEIKIVTRIKQEGNNETTVENVTKIQFYNK